jgi:hypothetical protein
MLFTGTMTPRLQPSVVVMPTEDVDSPTTSTFLSKAIQRAESSSSKSMKTTKKTPSQNQQPQKVKKSVDFNPKVRLRKISTHRRFSEEEKANTWYSPQEFKDIRAGAITTVKKMMKKVPVDNDPNDCSRGLESKTPKKNKARQARKLDIVFTVLSELTNCEESGHSSDLAAQIYTSCSQVCYEEAATRGALDAIEAWTEL